MNKESYILGEVFYQLFRENKLEAIDALINKIKEQGKYYLFPEIINYLEDKKDSDVIKGQLISAFPQNDIDVSEIQNFIENKLNKKIKIGSFKHNPAFILGGFFLGQGVMVDFSFKSIIKKHFQKWKI